VATNIVGDIASGIKGAVNKVLSQVESWINAGLNAADAAAGPFINFGSISLPRLHGGGVAPGAATDEVLAILRGREVVFTPEQLAAMAHAGFGQAQHSGALVNVEHAEFHDELDVETFAKVAAGILQAEGLAA
jgi:hypothetical protein